MDSSVRGKEVLRRKGGGGGPEAHCYLGGSYGTAIFSAHHAMNGDLDTDGLELAGECDFDRP